MSEIQDYSNFVIAAYLSAGIILLSFALFSFLKFKRNCRKLEMLEKNENK